MTPAPSSGRLKPALLDIPESFETERLILCCPRVGDGPAVFEAVQETLEELRPWMEWAQSPPTVEQSEEYCRLGRLRFLERSELPLLLFRREDNEYVGGSGLHRIDWEVPRFEIGYWCRRRHQGKGYITEAVRGISRFAFETLGAERVEIRCDAANERSRRVAERSGFRLEATLRSQARRIDGGLRDTLVYALLRSDYQERLSLTDSPPRQKRRGE